jgi:hypothetical protein
MQACGGIMAFSDKQLTQNELSPGEVIDNKIKSLEKQISSMKEVVECLGNQVGSLQKQHEVQSFLHAFWYILGAVLSLIFAWFSAIFFSIFAKKIAEKVTDKIE